ncbi:hypothetical protein [Luteolibacter soli]|uniref:Polysaccharide chain length determinant N-terminal domain-containing protein n=1 Tax=Luteolibacter soli TaxID=3135280 RepID=A0ABU9AZE7_9BACT
MISEIRTEGWIGKITKGGQREKGGSPDFRKALGIILAVGLAPLAMWLVGTAIIQVAPPVYQSEAILRLPAATMDTLGNAGAAAIIDEAAAALSAGHSPDPMAKLLLRSHLTLRREIGQDMIQVAARGHDPLEAQRTLLAVIESYERHRANSGSRMLVYATPIESVPVDVPHGMRMVLGCAGLASIALLLSIPLLRRLEGVPLVQSAQELLSAIARAFAVAEPPRASGYLPAAQPAG